MMNKDHNQTRDFHEAFCLKRKLIYSIAARRDKLEKRNVKTGRMNRGSMIEGDGFYLLTGYRRKRSEYTLKRRLKVTVQAIFEREILGRDTKIEQGLMGSPGESKTWCRQNNPF